MRPLSYIFLISILFCGCLVNNQPTEDKQLENYNTFVNQQNSIEEKQKIKSSIESVLPLISTDYEEPANYSAIQDEQSLALFYLSRAKLSLMLCGCDEYYVLGWQNATTGLWYESQGILNEADYYTALKENQNTTEERIKILSWAVSSKELAIESYEELTNNYPDYAEEINASYRIEAIERSLEINRNQIEKMQQS